MTPISITQLEQAINAARNVAPSVGQAAALSEDVAILADIYGELIFRQHKNFDADSLPEKERNVVLQWVAQSEGRAA